MAGGKNEFLANVAQGGTAKADEILAAVKKAGVGGKLAQPFHRPMPALIDSEGLRARVVIEMAFGWAISVDRSVAVLLPRPTLFPGQTLASRLTSSSNGPSPTFRRTSKSSKPSAKSLAEIDGP